MQIESYRNRNKKVLQETWLVLKATILSERTKATDRINVTNFMSILQNC